VTSKLLFSTALADSLVCLIRILAIVVKERIQFILKERFLRSKRKEEFSRNTGLSY
jgi:hypothetical protein